MASTAAAVPTAYEPPRFLFTDEPPDADSLAETNLTLLCLDYLRDLRRSYTPTELWEAEGMDADYLSLAVWALSRVFVRPGKLRFDAARVIKMKQEKDTMESGRMFFGGGGMGDEHPSFGNDPMYKSISGRDYNDDNTANNGWNTRAEIKSIREEINSGFYLTENIVIPKMDEIVKEVLLLRPNKQHSSYYGQTTTRHDTSAYEYNDAHSSNAHRYYLLNGLASGGGGGSDDKLAPPVTPSNNNPRSPRSQQLALALHGGPLTFGEIVHAGITSLGARTRIQAEREMVFHNPLFEQFVRAVSSKGFFSEKRKDEKRKSDAATAAAPSVDQAILTPEEERRRARVIYEEKYRKVVNKFRSKLAAKAETNQPQFNARQFQQHGIIHSQQQYQMQQHPQNQQYPQYGYSQPNIMHNQYNMPQSMDGSVANVADLQRQRREVKIERVRAGGRDGYALNQERGRMQLQMNYQQQHQQVQMQMLQNEQVQHHHQQTYQPLHQVAQLRQSPQRPPTPNRQLHHQPQQRQQQQQQQQQQQIPPPIITQQKPPPGQWETPKSQKHWPNSTKSTLSTQFNFDSHSSPFDNPSASNAKPPTPPRSNRSPSPSILQQTAIIPEPQPTPRLHDPDDEEDELNQREAEQHNAEGNQLMQKKQFQEALKSYSAALELSPQGPNSHVYYSNRSAAHLSLNDHVNSIRDSERSLELCPEYAKAHSRLGLAYFVSGQYEAAVEAYSVALEYEPDNEWNRSHYEKAMKKVAKSQRRSLQERPFDEETVHTNATNNNEESQEAGGDDREAMREADQYKDAGNAHMSNKEYEAALEKYSQAIIISPHGSNSHVYYSNRAAAYCYLGQYDAAANDCMTSIEIKPDYEKAHARLGLSRFFLEDYEGAIEAYERALVFDPNNAASKSYLGKAQKRLEEMIGAGSNENEEESYKNNVFLEQQEELQRAVEEQLMLQQGHDSDSGDSWG